MVIYNVLRKKDFELTVNLKGRKRVLGRPLPLGTSFFIGA